MAYFPGLPTSKIILVLLYRFSESQDSILGYKLCEKLVQEGHNLMVTSTAGKEELEIENEAAKKMTEQFKGSVHVISPDHDELGESSFEWIAKFL